MLFKNELLKNIKYALICIIVIIVLMYSSIYKYDTMNIDNAFSEVISSLPKIIKAIFGFGDYSFTSINSIYALCMLYISIILSLYFANMGSLLTSNCNEQKFDFIYITIPRKKIFITKLLANLTIITLLVLANTIICLILFNSYIKDLNFIIISNINLYLTSIFFYFLGSLLSAIFNKNLTNTINVGIMIFLYMMQILASLIENANILTLLNPLNQIVNNNILNGNNNLLYQVIILIFGLILIYPSYYIFKNKDL